MPHSFKFQSGPKARNPQSQPRFLSSGSPVAATIATSRVASLLLVCALVVLAAALRGQAVANDAATGELRVAYVSFSRYEGGPPLPQPVTFLPGEQVVMRAKLAGFRVAETSFQDYRVSLSYEVDATDARGILIGKLKKGEIREAVHKEDKDWLPTLDYIFLIPEMAEYGETKIRILIRDDISRQERVFEQSILVNGKRLPTLESIAVINFGFYRRQEDASPLPAGVYRPGNTLWAKFDLAGFRIEDKSHFHAECDVQVRDAEGKVLFEQPQALSTEATPEYPQRYLPGIFSLEIRPGTAKGNYAIAVIARDLLSGETAESVFPFAID